MSLQAMQDVLTRAASDRQFRNLLLSKPNKALAGYDLTAGEITQIKAMDANTLASGGTTTTETGTTTTGGTSSPGPGPTVAPDAKANV